VMMENNDPKAKNDGGRWRERYERECAWYMGVRVTRINENSVEWTNEEKEIVWNKLLIKKKGGQVCCTD